MYSKLNAAVFACAVLLLAAGLISGCSGRKEELPLGLEFVRTISIPADGRRLPAPRGLAFDEKSACIYAVDDNGGVGVFDKDGKALRSWKMPDSSKGKAEGIWVMKDGRIAVADTHYSRVVIFNADGTVSSMFGMHGTDEGRLGNPVGIVQDTEGNFFVSEYGFSDRVQKFSQDGRYIMGFGSSGTGPGQLQRPSGIAFSDGKIYVADAVNNRIQIFSQDGGFAGTIDGSGKGYSLYLPYGVRVAYDGSLFVIEYGNSLITRLSADGRLLGRFGGIGSDSGKFITPWGIAIDGKSEIYVADTGNRRISMFKMKE